MKKKDQKKEELKLLNYDPDSDALYVALPGGNFDHSERLSDGIRIDVDKAGKTIGLEILNLSRQIHNGETGIGVRDSNSLSAKGLSDLNPLMQQLSELFQKNFILESLRANPAFREYGPIAIVSNLRREEDSKSFNNYGFLCTSLEILRAWHSYVLKLKTRFGMDGTRLDYASLSQMPAEFIQQYLKTLFKLGGHFFSISIDKNIDTVFAKNMEEFSNGIAELGVTAWGNNSAERVFRVLHVLSYLASLTTHEKQKLLWITDPDCLAPKESVEKRVALPEIWQKIDPIYFSHALKHAGVLIPYDNDKENFSEDVLGIVDLFISGISQISLVPDQRNQVDPLSHKVFEFVAKGDVQLKTTFVRALGVSIENELGIQCSLYDIEVNSKQEEVAAGIKFLNDLNIEPIHQHKIFSDSPDLESEHELVDLAAIE